MASPDAAETGPSDEQLAGVILRVLAAVVALTLAGGIASAAGRLVDRDEAVIAAGANAPSGDVLAATTIGGRVGPAPGTIVADYIRARSGGVADGRGRRAAIVSFRNYRSASEAIEALAGTEVVSLLVAFPAGRPLLVAADVDTETLRRQQRDEATAEKKALEQLLPTVEDGDFRRQYEADIARLAALLAADGLRTDVVYGAVVLGPGTTLRRLAAAPEIRLVDLAPGEAAPGSGLAVGLRPEEVSRSGQPPVRPAM